MNKKITTIIKKIFRKSEDAERKEPELPAPHCVGSTDFFSYENEILYVEGWVFDTIYEMKHPQIIFYNEEKNVGQITPSTVYREDVSNILQNEQAKSSGFFFEVSVQSSVPLEVYFEYQTEAGLGRHYLGTVSERFHDANTIQIESVHPSYCIGNVCLLDENKELLSEYVQKLLAKYETLEMHNDIPTILAFDHMLGGGASAYLDEKKRIVLADGYRFLVIRQDVKGPTYYLTYEYGDFQIEFFERNLDLILQKIKTIQEIWINELVTYINPYVIMEKILELKEEKQASLLMLLHDYYAVCPAVNLMNEEGIYCQGASKEVCNLCIPKNRSNACLEYESGSVWREKWQNFLMRCDEVRAFSNDTDRLFRKIYPDLSNITIVPHQPHVLTVIKKEKKTTDTLNIGLLGVLCYKKGLDVVKHMVRHIENENLDIRIKLIGISDEEIDSPVFSFTGRYKLEEVPSLTVKEDIDIFLIPSIWPETFSYTTSEIISMNMPIAVFSIGAPVERVEIYEKGLVLSSMEPDEIITQLQKFMRNM